MSRPLTLPKLWVVELPDGTRRAARLVRHVFSGTAEAPVFDYEQAETPAERVRVWCDAEYWIVELAMQNENGAATWRILPVRRWW